ncbi:uncharacterized protein K460DRAFT_29555 [Cucurbitaria berberidis CBS 394.84]|uniref:Uncharacterized protein n=1 Tax=Cucurbitaria berberidis CBS 394.84 TaxID=1168544 RepID=A0A9P4LDN3_9PLEO|nr:uncharacterized protein K460DRAFT_29555 [Cucurbitaria berberidis CBS 394.84]KAF1851195.1 hypothetical protein K460DRAFT_29555 [Cucurbitaria berberidis CBS 394.84]
MTPSMSEKTSLLPIAESGLEAKTKTNSKTQIDHRAVIEHVFLLLSLLLTAFQFFVLYSIDGSSLAPSTTYYNAVLRQLARGLRISIPASLPTSVGLFFTAPYIARPDKIVITRYTVLLCYLVGSTLGALLI